MRPATTRQSFCSAQKCAICIGAFLLWIFAASPARADADEDWQTILSLDAGPPHAEWKTREEARSATLAFFNVQEKTLRDFIAKYPADPRVIDAKLRLAHLLAIRGDLDGNQKARNESAAIFQQLEASPATPNERKADIAFAKLSLFMRRVDPANVASESTRETLLNKVRAFQKSFPQDRRVPALLAEIATLFDSEPKRKKALLEEARASISGEANDELRQRIDDDLKRVAMLWKPLSMRWTAANNGREIDTESLRGKIVLIYFFAEWSPPAMIELDAVRDVAARFSTSDMQPLGISLDESSSALETTLRTHKIDWPIFFDGKGWESPLVRSLGINSLPTLWLLDRRGNLRGLNTPITNAEAAINQLLREH